MASGAAPDDRTVASLRGVGVRYESAGIDALVEIDVDLRAGERVAVLGASGSGKTTLLDVLAGLRRPDTGSLLVFGQDPAALRGRARRLHGRRIGTIGQHHDLAPELRVVHNVNAGRLGEWGTWTALSSLARPKEREAVVEALGAVDLAGRVDAVTGDLSGGERQRVAVARVLRQAPDLVLADEPTASVDPELADLVLDRLAGAAPTIVVNLHDPALARRHADRVIGLRSGRMVFDRPIGDLDDDTISDLYGGRVRT